jgi:type III pantothenate kinase
MWLLLDAGNTRLKWRCSDGVQVLEGGSIPIDGNRLESQFVAAFAHLRPVERLVISNVAGEDVGYTLQRVARGRLGCDVEFVVPAAEFRGLKNGYADPVSLGADRWAAMIGARELVRGPVCIVDCGTAVTLDWIAADGRHLGGMIIPGRHLMAECLVAGTRQIRLSPHDHGFAAQGLGTDTGSCVAAGTLACVAGMVERTVRNLGGDAAVSCLVAGGDAATFAAHISVPHQVVPDLTFRGLLAYARG